MSDKIVKNSFGVKIWFDSAVALMDDDLRERLHYEMAPCTEQEFFDAYAILHEQEFGEEWEYAKINPVT